MAVSEPSRANWTAARKETLNLNPQLVNKVKSFRLANFNNLSELMLQTVQALKEKGFTVTVAKNAAEARSYILGLVKSCKVTITSSPLLREIGLEQELIAQGVDLKQTGLYAYPEHEWQDPGLRAKVRTALAEAEFGITGADALIAEHGTVVLMENQGDMRAVSNLATHHLVVASIDKIVASTGEAVDLAQLLSVLRSGFPVSRYLSFITGPSSTGDVEGVLVKGMHGPLRVDVILVDDGRLEALQSGNGGVLQCIGCGGCLQGSSEPTQAESYLELFLAKRTELVEQSTEPSELRLVCPVGIFSE